MNNNQNYQNNKAPGYLFSDEKDIIGESFSVDYTDAYQKQIAYDDNNLNETVLEQKFKKMNLSDKNPKESLCILNQNNDFFNNFEDNLNISIQDRKKDDYLYVRKLPNFSENEYQNIKRNISNNLLPIQQYLMNETKKNDFNQFKTSFKVGPLMPLAFNIENNYEYNPQYKNEMQKKYDKLKKYIYNFRYIFGDGNCFYRAVIFKYIELLIIHKKIDIIKKLIIDINRSFQSNEIRTRLKTEKQGLYLNNTMTIMIIILELIQNNRINDAHFVFYKSLLSCEVFDFSLILYLRYIIYTYIKQNENKLYLESFPVLIGNLLPSNYEKNGVFDFNSFYETFLLKMYQYAEKIVIYLTPFVLGVDLNVILFDDNEDEVVKKFSFSGKSDINISDPIFILNRRGHYENIYSLEENQKYNYLLGYYRGNYQPRLIIPDYSINVGGINNNHNNTVINPQRNKGNYNNQFNMQNYQNNQNATMYNNHNRNNQNFSNNQNDFNYKTVVCSKSNNRLRNDMNFQNPNYNTNSYGNTNNNGYNNNQHYHNQNNNQYNNNYSNNNQNYNYNTNNNQYNNNQYNNYNTNYQTQNNYNKAPSSNTIPFNRANSKTLVIQNKKNMNNNKEINNQRIEKRNSNYICNKNVYSYDNINKDNLVEFDKLNNNNNMNNNNPYNNNMNNNNNNNNMNNNNPYNNNMNNNNPYNNNINSNNYNVNNIQNNNMPNNNAYNNVPNNNNNYYNNNMNHHNMPNNNTYNYMNNNSNQMNNNNNKNYKMNNNNNDNNRGYYQNRDNQGNGQLKCNRCSSIHPGLNTIKSICPNCFIGEIIKQSKIFYIDYLKNVVKFEKANTITRNDLENLFLKKIVINYENRQYTIYQAINELNSGNNNGFNFNQIMDELISRLKQEICLYCYCDVQNIEFKMPCGCNFCSYNHLGNFWKEKVQHKLNYNYKCFCSYEYKPNKVLELCNILKNKISFDISYLNKLFGKICFKCGKEKNDLQLVDIEGFCLIQFNHFICGDCLRNSDSNYTNCSICQIRHKYLLHNY